MAKAIGQFVNKKEATRRALNELREGKVTRCKNFENT